jgi:RimJ/RimL family protein N-acetyltransferase
LSYSVLDEETILIDPDQPQKPVTDAVLETERLQLRRLTLDDAAFLIDVFGDPAFKRFVGDRKIRTIDQARGFIEKGPFESYRRFGFGHYVVELKGSGTPIGICGYVKRDTLPDVDIGFSLLPQFRSQGYAFEAASAVMAHGRDTLGFRRIVAIASPDNDPSIRLLGRLGLSYEGRVKLGSKGDELNLYSWGSQQEIRKP